MLKCVGFISHSQLDGPNYVGTVFLVATNDGMLHLVTAKHVAEVFDPGPFVIAMNAVDGKPRFLRGGDNIRWFYHPTESGSVDVAVCPFSVPDVNLFDARAINEKSFASDSRIYDYGIGLGDEIFVVGLFTRYFGSSKSFPLCAPGTLQ